MASINKLSLRGVRSFSPDADEQVLEFYFPCTIIVGANGCGKTTIIEALKFAVCGALPPGGKAGQAFVHDPKSIGSNIVKAQVKLRFTNKASKSMVTIRSMEVQQKKTTMTFKQLDGVLRCQAEDGSRQSLTHKCTELDKQIPTYLGVSKAVLEHVIFCHQEEANWPLQEGAALKKRFDDIFDSTRYTKALKVFAEQKKHYNNKVKDIKVDLAGLKANQHAAKGFRAELSKYNEQMESVEDQISESRKLLKENEEEMKRVQDIVNQVIDIRSEVKSRKDQLNLKEGLTKETERMLEENLTRKFTIRELKEKLRDFDSTLNEQNERKKELEEERNAYQRELSDLEEKEGDLKSKIVRLETQKEEHDKVLIERSRKVMEIISTYDLNTLLTPFSQSQSQASHHADLSITQGSLQTTIAQEDIDDFNRAVGRKDRSLNEEIDTTKRRHQDHEDEIQKQITSLEGELEAIKRERNKLQEENREAHKELSQISLQNKPIPRLREDEVEEARRRAVQFAKERDEANSNPRRTEIPIEIRSLEDKMESLKPQIEADQRALEEKRNSVDTHNAVTFLRDQISNDLEDLKQGVLEADYLFQRFNIAAPKIDDEQIEYSIAKANDDILSNFRDIELELSQTSDKINEIKGKISARQELRDRDDRDRHSQHKRMEEISGAGGSIAKIEAVVQELQQYERSIAITTPMGDIESKPKELMLYLDERLEEVDGSLSGIQPNVVAEIIKRLKRLSEAGSGNFRCPCCTKQLRDKEEIRVFLDEMKKLKGKNSPLIEGDESNEVSKSNYQRWRKIVIDNMDSVLEFRRIANEANDLEQSIYDSENFISDRQKELGEILEKSHELQTELDQARILLEHSKSWQTSADGIASKSSDAAAKEAEATAAETSIHTDVRDLKTVEKDLAENLRRKDKLSNDILKLNKDMTSLNNLIATKSQQAANFENIARQKQERFAAVKELVEKKNNLNKTISRISKEDKKLQSEIIPIQNKKTQKEKEKEKMRNLAKDEIDGLNGTHKRFQDLVKDLRNIEERINDFDGSDASSLDRFAIKLKELQIRKEERRELMAKIQPDLDEATKVVSDQERQRKLLNDNIRLMKLKSEIVPLQKEIESLEGQLNDVEGHDTCDDDFDHLESRKADIDISIAKLEGQRGEILESVRGLKRKLSQQEYRNIDEEHRVAMIKFETTQMAVKDIEKYHAALDKALLRFHSLKIAEINTIIRDLWNLTYKGEDITSIELVSGQDSSSRASRSYNYRVVMTKGSTQLDMRGRCSAGQRVLASIVIRLALAETFCVECGVIALDEPTVNLDYNNKRGLATALAQIIASRAQQSNFQLLLITHDEDFVALMKTELSSQTGFSMPEKYFHVRREQSTDGKYYSKIDAIDWEELV